MRTFMPPSSYLWFMVTARNRPASIGRGRDQGLTADPRAKLASRMTALSSFAKNSARARARAILKFFITFISVLLPTRFFVFSFRVRPVKAALRLSN